MNKDADNSEEGFALAIYEAKNQNFEGARRALGIGDEISDNELIEGLISLSNGIELMVTQQPMAALEPLKKALPIIDASNDDDARFFVHTLANFSEGLNKLFSGRAHEATELLNLSTDAVKRVSFFVPNFELPAYSFKAASLLALANSYIHENNVQAAEETMSKVRQVHDTLLAKLDPEDPSHAMGFAEIFGTRVEIAFGLALALDLSSLDLNTARKRIDGCRDDVQKLKEWLGKIPGGPIASLLSSYPIVFTALDDICHSLEIVLLERRPFKKEEVEALARADEAIFKARQLTQMAGERGSGVLLQLDRMKKFQQHLLLYGKVATEDFGRFNGVIALAAFLALHVIIYLTLKPTGYEAMFYLFGELVLSLIVGFGYGALRFQPLLKMFAKAMEKKDNR